MIYTIGEKISYEIGLQKFEADPSKPMHKMGAGFITGQPDFYRGGSVFKTREEAQAFAESKPEENWGVYGVLAEWERDVQQYDDEPFGRLLVQRQIVRAPS